MIQIHTHYVLSLQLHKSEGAMTRCPLALRWFNHLLVEKAMSESFAQSYVVYAAPKRHLPVSTQTGIISMHVLGLLDRLLHTCMLYKINFKDFA